MSENLIALAKKNFDRQKVFNELAEQCASEPIMDIALDKIISLREQLALAFEAGRVAEREECISIVESYKVSIGNSRAGELACEWTMENLREIRDAIRARSTKVP
jgi:hypothetical protein